MSGWAHCARRIALAAGEIRFEVDKQISDWLLLRFRLRGHAGRYCARAIRFCLEIVIQFFVSLLSLGDICWGIRRL